MERYPSMKNAKAEKTLPWRKCSCFQNKF